MADNGISSQLLRHMSTDAPGTRRRRYGREVGAATSLDQSSMLSDSGHFIRRSISVPHASQPSIPSAPTPGIRTWPDIAEESRNGVVKILSQCVRFDWEMPFRRAEDHQATGTGFFIDAEGHIVTNAHVIEDASKVWLTIPSQGERRFEAHVIGVCFDADLALLKAVDAPVSKYLEIGNSDQVHFGEEVMTLGYPLGMESLKLTIGVVSGRQDSFFQTDAPLNPGNSGGPMMSRQGVVVGVNVAIVAEASNVGFAIPVHQLHVLLNELKSRPRNKRIVHKPILGANFSNGSGALHSFLGCRLQSVTAHAGPPRTLDSVRSSPSTSPTPSDDSTTAAAAAATTATASPDCSPATATASAPASDVMAVGYGSEYVMCDTFAKGVYVQHAHEGFPLHNAGVRDGDILHRFDGYELDDFGQAQVPWSPYARANISDLMSGMTHESTPQVVFSRRGTPKKAVLSFVDPRNRAQPILPVTREMHPPYEYIDYEVIGGLVIMQFSLNHLDILSESNALPEVLQNLLPLVVDVAQRSKPRLLVSTVMVGSSVGKTNVLTPGMLLRRVNGIKVHTLRDLRRAILLPLTRTKGLELFAKQLEEDHAAGGVSGTVVQGLSELTLARLAHHHQDEDDAQSQDTTKSTAGSSSVGTMEEDMEEHFITVTTFDNDMLVLPLKEMLVEELELSSVYMYPLSSLISDLLDRFPNLQEFFEEKKMQLKKAMMESLSFFQEDDDDDEQSSVAVQGSSRPSSSLWGGSER